MLERWIAKINKESFLVLYIKHTAVAIESLVIFFIDFHFYYKRNISFLNKIQRITNVYNVKGNFWLPVLDKMRQEHFCLFISSAKYSLC